MLEASDDETEETVSATSGIVKEEVGKMDLIKAQKTDEETQRLLMVESTKVEISKDKDGMIYIKDKEQRCRIMVPDA